MDPQTAQRRLDPRIFEIALQTAHLCVFELDLPQQRYTLFANAEAIFGKPEELLLRELETLGGVSQDRYWARVAAYFAHPEDYSAILEAHRSLEKGLPVSYQARLRAGDGAAFIWCKVDMTPLPDGDGGLQVVGVVSNIDELRSRSARYEAAAKTDLLTGLYNKVSAERAIKKILSVKKDVECTLIVLDLDDFKQVNDTYGHPAGDTVLRETAQQLRGMFRSTDIVGRWGGDEFLVFAVGMPNSDHLRQKLSQMLACEGFTYPVTKSVGAACYPGHAHDWDTLCSLADKALYQAKRQKSRYQIYQP